MTFAELIEKHLDGRTRAEFAEAAGIGTRTLQDLCAGRAVPRRATVRMLALTLGVPDKVVLKALEATPAPEPSR